VKWCRSEQGPGINDAQLIDRKVLGDYAAYLRDMVTRYYYLLTLRLLVRRLIKPSGVKCQAKI